MNEAAKTDAPRLAGFRGGGMTLKPDDLNNHIFTIVDAHTVMRRDGTIGHKWIVKHDDGTLGLYWAAGFAPPHQVAQWFRDYPGKPLTVCLIKEEADGYARFRLEQQLELDEEPVRLRSVEGAAEELAEQVPF